MPSKIAFFACLIPFRTTYFPYFRVIYFIKMKRFIALLGLLFFANCIAAQLKSPDAFLGYELGTKWTPHHKIVKYFSEVASYTTQLMKLEQYGTTNEGRELILAIISSAENMQKLDAIRKNNLALASGQLGNVNTPTIVWLSYNVHGNETSSSEVAMKMLYELVSGKNNKLNDWIKNVVVIIDPCLNPDGRDRYVNWYNSMAGRNPNSNMDSREHNEPWPGGRTNHYNFDLNRDWTWQTQVETQQRIKKYNEWMPQIHCDFHEQGINNPYYFAPAAEPFHDVITPWQREFQHLIGKNHASYFDANGWLYFTKERFDLFYPAYGDTYPTYKGAIGMTYEQAGHGSGGLAAMKDDEEVLTLKDRIAHHFTTSISTVEMAAQQAPRLMQEFKNYFQKATTTGIGNFKSYVLKPNSNAAVLRNLLAKNNISFSEVKGSATSYLGYDFASGKEAKFLLTDGDILIQSKQALSAMVKVLLEPQSFLSDSATYDITSWSLPYVFNATAYATTSEILAIPMVNQQVEMSVPKTSYGYVVKWGELKNVQFVGKLLQANFVLKYAEQAFEMNGEKFDRGSVLILPSSKNNLPKAAEIAQQQQVKLFAIGSGLVNKGFDFGSDRQLNLKKKNVVLLTGDGVDANAAGELWHFFEQDLNYPLTLINANDLAYANLKNIDVIIMPNGRYKNVVSKEANSDLKNWVRQGGKIVAIEGAVSQLISAEFGGRVKKGEDVKEESSYADLKNYENRERDFVSGYIPGAVYKLEIDKSHPLAFGYGNTMYSLKQNSDVLDFLKDGWNVGYLKTNNKVAGFVGSKIKHKIKDGSTICALGMGSGSVIYFLDDPIFRSFWEGGKLMVANAVFFNMN